MLLVDTSVWIEVFRKRRPLRLEEHAAIEEVVTCLPVLQEVLQGFREEDAFRVVAMHNTPPALAELRRRHPVLRPGPGTSLSRSTKTKQAVQ